MTRLPVEDFEQQIVDTVSKNQITIIAAETGAGKSTMVPLMLLRAGFSKTGLIGITEPRRVAAIGVAEWVAELHGTKIGQTVGYQISQDNKTSRQTTLKFMTEGILLRELHSDQSLRKYSVVVVDEAHERGVNQDLILALLKKVVEKRADLKIIVMSATIDEQKFADYFGGAPVIKVPGRVFPVEIRYANSTPSSPAGAVAAKVAEICAGTDPGDILAFLPDEDTIKKACGAIEEEGIKDIRILPLYGAQAPDEQREVFKRDGKRRVIVSTNIAETSLTIDGVRHVVDSGLIKAMVYVNASMSALTVVEHSKAGCDQRKGRAGRTQDGVCHRLFTKEEFEDRDGFTKPEILRMSLDQVFLHLRVLGYSKQEILDLDFMDAPGTDRWNEAEERLKLLGAMDSVGNITEDGKKMESLPLAPMLARMLINAQAQDCIQEVSIIVAALTSRPVFIRPKDKDRDADASHAVYRNTQSDAITTLNVHHAWVSSGRSRQWARTKFFSGKALGQIDQTREHILGLLKVKEDKEAKASNEKIRKAIASGLVVNLCQKAGRFSYSWQTREVFVHPSSSMFKQFLPQFLVCTEIIETKKVYARGCDAVETEWIRDMVPASACKVDTTIERDIFGSRALEIYETLTWQGTQISRRKVDALNSEHIPGIAKKLVEEISQGYGGFHPQSENLRRVWHTIVEIKKLDAFGWSTWSSSDQERTKQRAEKEAIKEKITQSISSQIAHCKFLNEVQSTPIVLNLADYVGAEEAAKYETKLKADADRQTVLEIQRKKEHEIWLAQDAENRKNREARASEFKVRYEKLVERMEPLPVFANDRKYQIENFRWRVDTGSAFLADDLKRFEMWVSAAEKENKDYFDLAQKVEVFVGETWPVCPMCGGDWHKQPAMSRWVCEKTHDIRRLMGAVGFIKIIETDRSQMAATLFITNKNHLHVELRNASKGVWNGYKFKILIVKHNYCILPESLAGSVVEIKKDLETLREMERLFNAQKKECTALGANAVLKFTVENGAAVCKGASQFYVAEFGEKYPQDGELWACKIGSTVEGTRRETRVQPLLKLTWSVEDLEEMKTLMREMYPGLPDSVFE